MSAERISWGTMEFEPEPIERFSERGWGGLAIALVLLGLAFFASNSHKGSQSETAEILWVFFGLWGTSSIAYLVLIRKLTWFELKGFCATADGIDIGYTYVVQPLVRCAAVRCHLDWDQVSEWYCALDAEGNLYMRVKLSAASEGGVTDFSVRLTEEGFAPETVAKLLALKPVQV